MKKFLKLFTAAAIITAMLTGCSASTNGDINFKPTQAPTAQPTTELEVTSEPEKTEESEVEATAEPIDKVVDSAIYLPKENRRITMLEYNGSNPDKVFYISAKDNQNAEDGYKVSSYYEDQAMYYTDYFMTDEGMFGRFSDDEEKKVFLVLPKDLTEGAEYELNGEKAVVEAVGADFELESFSAKECTIVKVNSNAYGKEVTNVYAPELGLAAQYIEYDEEVIDIIKIIDSYEDISTDEAQKTIDDSKF